MDGTQGKLEKLIALGNLMTEVQDTDILMEIILEEARRLCNCDAGSIYTRDDNYLVFGYSQNETIQRGLPKGKKIVYITFRIPIDNSSIAGYVANTGNIIRLDDVYNVEKEIPHLYNRFGYRIKQSENRDKSVNNVPFSFNASFDQKTGYATGSVLGIPMRNTHGKIVGVLQLINALDDRGNVCPFKDSDIPIIQHFANMAAVALDRSVITRAIILRMIKMAEMRDPSETGAHVNRVGAYSAEIYEAWAKRKGLLNYEIQHNKDLLRIAAMLHDVGKVGIPDSILKKPGKLNDEEYEVMKTHPVIGSLLFIDSNSELDAMSKDIALSHHERWDGGERGYPGYIDIVTGKSLLNNSNLDTYARKPRGDTISLWARIVAIADVYDALSHRRCYKEAWTQEDVLAELIRSAGTQFDPELIEVFISIREVMEAITAKYPNPED